MNTDILNILATRAAEALTKVRDERGLDGDIRVDGSAVIWGGHRAEFAIRNGQPVFARVSGEYRKGVNLWEKDHAIRIAMNHRCQIRFLGPLS